MKLKDIKVGMYVKYLFTVKGNNALKDFDGYYISYCFAEKSLEGASKEMEALDIYLFNDIKTKEFQETLSLPLEESHQYYNQYSEVEVLYEFQLPDGVSDPKIIKEFFFEKFPEYKI